MNLLDNFSLSLSRIGDEAKTKSVLTHFSFFFCIDKAWRPSRAFVPLLAATRGSSTNPTAYPLTARISVGVRLKLG